MADKKPLSFQETPLRKTSAALQPAKVFGMGDPLATKLFGKLDNAALDYLEPITTTPIKPNISGPIPGSYEDLVEKGWVKPQQQMAKGGKVKKYAEGGKVEKKPRLEFNLKDRDWPKEFGPDPLLTPPKTKSPKATPIPTDVPKKLPIAPMAKGGYVRGDGCCQRGKTKGKMR